MTLNLTLLTADAIYQSADFQLTDGTTNAPLHTESMKLVTVHYPSWEGFVTYTGVGRWQGRDTAEWIVKWLTGLEDASPDQVIDRLRERGTAFLRDIERSPGGRRHPHTFVFASFVDGGPRVATISNFEDCGGRSDASPSVELRVDSRVMRQRPLLLPTGRKRSIRRASRRELERVAARSDTSPARIRYALTRMNAEAAASPEAAGTVSVGCSVSSFRRDGSGFQDLTEGAMAMPRSLMNGHPLPDFTALLGKNAGYVRGISFARSSPGTEQEPYSPCLPKFTTPADAGGYQVDELTSPELESAVAGDVNEARVVLGSGTRPGHPGTHLLCIWDRDKAGELVGFTGNPGVRGLNQRGEIGVTADMSDSSVHAARWRPGCAAQDLGTFHGTESEAFADSGAFAINNEGVIVGWVSVSNDPQDRGQSNNRPAAWIPGLEPVFLEDFGFAWGQAIDVNDAGTVLVVAYTEGIAGRCMALLWNPAPGTYALVGSDEPDGVYPNTLTSDGLILGNGRSRTGETIPCLSNAGGPWARLGTPDGWYATTMNDSGDVAGSAAVQGFGRPWLRRSNGEIVWLPFLDHHECRPASMTNTGLLAGTAHTDHGTHALLWTSSS
jgi:hypothetical protein